MKPMPASRMQRPICSGLRSILTPSAASTSAAPDRDDSARLPCLATGTPAPATISAAQVEMLNEPEASPPVPTTSMASGGALTRSILARIAVTAPVISSTVSPRTRNAISSAPICDGVASPDIICSNAIAASSRPSVAPVATLPTIPLNSAVTPKSLARIPSSPVPAFVAASSAPLAAARSFRSTPRRCRENSSASDGRARTRCFRDEIARHGPEARYGRAPSPGRLRFRQSQSSSRGMLARSTTSE